MPPSSLLRLLPAMLLATSVRAEPPLEELPLWELGVGAGALYTPDYPSSAEHHTRAIALPYVVYRGDVLRVGDGQAARAVAAESSRTMATADSGSWVSVARISKASAKRPSPARMAVASPKAL